MEIQLKSRTTKSQKKAGMEKESVSKKRRAGIQRDCSRSLVVFSMLAALSFCESNRIFARRRQSANKHYNDLKYVYHPVGNLDVTLTKIKAAKKQPNNQAQKNAQIKFEEVEPQQAYQGVIRVKRYSDILSELRITFKKSTDPGFTSSSGIRVTFKKPSGFITSSDPQTTDFFENPKNVTKEGEIVGISAVGFSKTFPYHSEGDDPKPENQIKLVKMRAKFPPQKHLEELRTNNPKQLDSELPLTELELIYTLKNFQIRISYQEELNEGYDLGRPFSEINQVNKASVFIIYGCFAVIIAHLIGIMASMNNINYTRNCKRNFSAPFGLFLASFNIIGLLFQTSQLGLLTLVGIIILIMSFMVAISNFCWLAQSLNPSKSKNNPRKFEYNFKKGQILLTLLCLLLFLIIDDFDQDSIPFLPLLYIALAGIDLAYDWVSTERLFVFGFKLVRHCLVGLALTELIFEMVRRGLCLDFILQNEDIITSKRNINLVLIQGFFVVFLIKFLVGKYRSIKSMKELDEGVAQTVLQAKFENRDRKGFLKKSENLIKNFEIEVEESCDEPVSTQRNLNDLNKIDKFTEVIDTVENLVTQKVVEPRCDTLTKKAFKRREVRLDGIKNKNRASSPEHSEENNQETLVGKAEQLSTHFIARWKNIKTSGLYSVIRVEKGGYFLKQTTLSSEMISSQVVNNKVNDKTDLHKSRRGWMMCLTKPKQNSRDKDEDNNDDGEEPETITPVLANNIHIPKNPKKESDFLAVLKIQGGSGRGFIRLVNTRSKRVVLNCTSNELSKYSKTSKSLKASILLHSSQNSKFANFRASVTISPKNDPGMIRTIIFSNSKLNNSGIHQNETEKPLSCTTMTFRKDLNLLDLIAKNPKFGMNKQELEELKQENLIKIHKNYSLHDYKKKEEMDVVSNDRDFEAVVSDCTNFIFIKNETDGFKTKKISKKNKKLNNRKSPNLVVLVKYGEPIMKGEGSRTTGINSRRLKMKTFSYSENYQYGCSLDHLKNRVLGDEEVVKFGPLTETTAFLITKDKLAVVDFMRDKVISIYN